MINMNSGVMGVATKVLENLPKAQSFKQQDPNTEDIIENRRSLQRVHINRNSGSFGQMIRDAIDSVDQASKTADKQVEDIVSGKAENIHEAMISLQKAQLSFQLMLEVRNKAVETYQELSRMQI